MKDEEADLGSFHEFYHYHRLMPPGYFGLFLPVLIKKLQHDQE